MVAVLAFVGGHIKDNHRNHQPDLYVDGIVDGILLFWKRLSLTPGGSSPCLTCGRRADDGRRICEKECWNMIGNV